MGDGYLEIVIDGIELDPVTFPGGRYEAYVETYKMHEFLMNMKDNGVIKKFTLKGYKYNFKERVRGRGIQYIPDDILVAESNDTMKEINSYINPDEWG